MKAMQNKANLDEKRSTTKQNKTRQSKKKLKAEQSKKLNTSKTKHAKENVIIKKK